MYRFYVKDIRVMVINTCLLVGYSALIIVLIEGLSFCSVCTPIIFVAFPGLLSVISPPTYPQSKIQVEWSPNPTPGSLSKVLESFHVYIYFIDYYLDMVRGS